MEYLKTFFLIKKRIAYNNEWNALLLRLSLSDVADLNNYSITIQLFVQVWTEMYSEFLG